MNSDSDMSGDEYNITFTFNLKKAGIMILKMFILIYLGPYILTGIILFLMTLFV